MKLSRVLIVDNHLLIRIGLRHLLAEECRDVVFGEAGTADEALAQVAKQPWDVVVLDVAIPDQGGFYVLREVLVRRPATRVLLLSSRADPRQAARALKMGAAGYLRKDARRSALVKVFKNVLADPTHFAEALPPDSHSRVAEACTGLSPREQQVLLAVAAGQRIGEIAAELNLSIKTVSTFRHRILDKLHLKSTADLVRYVIDHKLA
jgi:two-component system, NarL family, invasion response regulator UvrY